MPGAQTYLQWGAIILLIAAFYFLIFRPQRNREKKDNLMRGALEVGDRICSIGGIIGRIVAIGEQTVTIETSSNHTRMKLFKWAIRNKVDEDDNAIDHQKAKGAKAPKKEAVEETSETAEETTEANED